MCFTISFDKGFEWNPFYLNSILSKSFLQLSLFVVVDHSYSVVSKSICLHYSLDSLHICAYAATFYNPVYYKHKKALLTRQLDMPSGNANFYIDF